MNEFMVQKLFYGAFEKKREERSNEFKLGALAGLRFRILKDDIKCPYAVGSAERDAYYSGVDEGYLIWCEQTGR